MMRRGTGCHHDPPYARGNWDASERLGAVGPLPESLDWTGHIDYARDQDPTQACVGFGFARAIQLSRRVQDQPLFPMPSPLHIYDIARGAAGRQWVNPETHEQMDDGTSMAAAADALEQCGFCSENACPWDAAKVKYPLDVGYYLSAIDQRGVLSHRVLSEGASRAQDIKAAMHLGHGVVLATDVDSSFEDLSAGAVWQGPQEREGGHALPVCGYDPVSLWVINSWGDSWADHGVGRIAWSVVATESVRSIWVVDTVPDFLAAWHSQR